MLEISDGNSIVLSSLSVFVIDRMAKSLEIVTVDEPLHVFFVRA
jgi:hypothetical protein